jgi:hypothetical protein
MANLKEWQTKITLSRLYRIDYGGTRQPLKPAIYIQGQAGTDTANIYFALDGTTPNTAPASLNEMGRVASAVEGGKAIENIDANFLAVTASAGTPTIFLSGIRILEDLGAIS